METTEAIRLIDYVYWMRDRITRQAAALEPGDLISADPVTTRDLRATLVHELDVEWSWRERLRGSSSDDWGPDAELKPDDYPNLDAILDHWRRDEAEMRDWVAGLSQADLRSPAPHERDHAYPLWYFLMHLVMHAGQQFSDAAVLLTELGLSPGDLGFLEYADVRG